MTRNPIALLVFRLALGALFVFAGIVKVLDPLDFAQSIRNYHVVGSALSLLAALLLPWLEIVAGAFLATGFWKRAAALLIVLMLVFFIVLTVVTILRGIDVDCGCFGALSRKADIRLIVEDILLLVMAGSIVLAPEGRRVR
jgi:putative oxidoreductase